MLNFSMLRAKSGVLALGMLLFVPLPSYAVEYCVGYFYGGMFGVMSFDLTTDNFLVKVDLKDMREV